MRKRLKREEVYAKIKLIANEMTWGFKLND
jgi:hypothetical protein